MTWPTDEHSLLCKVYGPAPWSVHELTPQVSDFGFWRDRMGDRRGEVVFGLLDGEGRIVLTRAGDYPSGVFRVPSGGILHAETAIDALYREVGEELGLGPSSFTVLCYAGGIEFRFAASGTGGSAISFPSYCFLLSRNGCGHPGIPAETGEPPEIESCRSVSPAGLAGALGALRALRPPWEDWGHYRARSGEIVLAAWQAHRSAAEPGAGQGLLDLSLPVSPEIVRYPGDEPPSVQVSMARATDSGGGAIPSWEVTRWSLSSHAGTHVDAPSHMFPGGQTIDQVDLRRLAGPAVVVDCKRATAASRPVAASDLPEATTLRGKIVLLKLGVAGDLVSGSPGPGFAGLTAEAARLLAQAGVMAVGVDALSVDPVGGGHKAHGVLLGAGIPIIEALDLRAVMPGLAGLFAALPLKLAGAEAAPCRAVLVSHKVTTQGESQ